MGMGYGLMVECLLPMYKALELITTLFKNKHTQSLITAFEKQRQGDLSEFNVSLVYTARQCYSETLSPKLKTTKQANKQESRIFHRRPFHNL